MAISSEESLPLRPSTKRMKLALKALGSMALKIRRKVSLLGTLPGSLRNFSSHDVASGEALHFVEALALADDRGQCDEDHLAKVVSSVASGSRIGQ